MQSAHLWAISDFVSRSNALGTPQRQMVCRQPAHLWDKSDFVPRAKVIGTSEAEEVMYPIRPLVGHSGLCLPL